MNSTAKKIFGTGCILGLALLSLSAQSAATFGNLPLWFEAGADKQFIAHGSSSEFIVSATGTEFTLKKSSGETAACTLQFVGAGSAPKISGAEPLAGKISHFTGSQPAQWQTGVPTFARVQVNDVYPGINVVYYGNQRTLEYDFNLAAGVNPSAIALHFAGAEKISLDSQGALVIKVNAGQIIQHAPVAYQMIGGSRLEVAASYKLLDAHTAAFTLGSYDHSQPLVIDPVLSYSTYYGANYGDAAWAIAVNPTDGSVYVAGQTFSTKVTNGIPFWTAGAYQTNYHGGVQAGDAFVARFDNSGTNLIYATYLGGSADDAAYAIAVDAAGNAFITGATISTNFPIVNPIPGGDKIGGQADKKLKTFPTDAFVAELDPSGANLIYSTYIGGNATDVANGIALDSSDNAFITGFTYSTNFPATPGAFQTHLQCTNTFYINANAFMAEIAAGGGALNYATYLGGTNYDIGRAIAFNDNKVFVTGYTTSTNFPAINYLPGGNLLNGVTNYPKNKKVYSFPDAFVTAFDTANLATPLYSTLLGGTNNDTATGIAADASGNAYVVGFTSSTNFPYTTTNVTELYSFVHTNDFNKKYYPATNGFLTKITWNGSQTAIGYSAMFGGKGGDIANGVALDPDGNAYVVGSATSTNFPVTTNNISGYLSATNSSKKNKNWSDAVVIAFNADATALLYSTYLGGLDKDYGNAIAVDPAGNAYIAGQTLSTNFPAVSAYQPHRSGTNDMFIAKISADNLLILNIAPHNATTSSLRSLAAIVQLPQPPSITLKWKMFPADHVVESAADLNSTDWQIVPQTPAYADGSYSLTVPTTNSAQFFRLRPR